MLRVGSYVRTGIRGFKLPAIFRKDKGTESTTDYNIEKRKEIKAYADNFDARNPGAPNPIRAKLPEEPNKIEAAFHKSLHKSAIDTDGNLTAPTYDAVFYMTYPLLYQKFENMVSFWPEKLI